MRGGRVHFCDPSKKVCETFSSAETLGRFSRQLTSFQMMVRPHPHFVRPQAKFQSVSRKGGERRRIGLSGARNANDANGLPAGHPNTERSRRCPGCPTRRLHPSLEAASNASQYPCGGRLDLPHLPQRRVGPSPGLRQAGHGASRRSCDLQRRTRARRQDRIGPEPSSAAGGIVATQGKAPHCASPARGRRHELRSHLREPRNSRWHRRFSPSPSQKTLSHLLTPSRVARRCAGDKRS